MGKSVANPPGVSDRVLAEIPPARIVRPDDTLRIAAFAAFLVVAFAAAALAGRAIEPRGEHPRARTDDRGRAHDVMKTSHAAAADPVRGLAARRGRRSDVVVEQPELRRGRAETLRFRIVDERGATVRDFDVEHEKRMHLILARRDLTGFQHLHPEQGPDGAWSAPRALDDAGSYRLFADFSHDGDAAHARRRPARRRRRRPAPAPRPAADRGQRRRLRRRALRRAGRTPSCASPITRDGKPVAHRALPRRRRPPGRAARGRPGVPARPPRPATARRFAVDVPDPRPLPPVPPVQARGPRPHRRVHAGGALAMSRAALELPIDGHDVRVVREPDRAQAQQARRASARRVNYATEKATVEFDAGASRPDELRRRGRGRRLPGRAARRPSRSRPSRGRRDRAAAPPPARLRAAVAAGAADLDDPGAAVRQLAVAVAAARDAGRPVGRVAVPPRRVGEPQARRRHDGHAGLARRARRLAVVAVRAVPRRRRHARHAHELRPHPRAPGGGRGRDLPRDRRGRDHVHPRRPLLRGARQAPRRRGAARRCSSWAPRTSSSADGASAACRSSSSRSATASWCGPGEKIATDGVVEEGTLGGRPVAAHRRVRAGRGAARRRRRGRDRQRRRPPRRARDEGRRRHRAGPDRPARHRRAVRQGAGPAARRPRLGHLRPDRDRPRGRDARVLARRRRVGRRSRSPPPSPC